MPFKNHEKSILSGITPVSNIFIDKFLTKAPAVYGVIYIYGLRMFSSGNYNITNSDIAEILDVLESDVMKAWKYWHEKGIINYDVKTETIEFKEPSEEIKKENEQKIEVKNENTSSFLPAVIPCERAPKYSPEEIAAYIEKNKSVKELFLMAQSSIGRLLNVNDMGTIFSFYEWYHLPLEVVQMLISYCCQNNHRDLRYMEKVVIAWVEAGINSLEMAEERIKSYNTQYREVMREFGLSMRNPAPSEEAYMKKWFKEYCFSIDIVKIACEKTIGQINQPSFNYADTILERWHDKKVKTIEDVEKDAEDFKLEKEKKKINEIENKKQPQIKKNRFVNYEQREWDFEKIEQLERKYRKKKLEG